MEGDVRVLLVALFYDLLIFSGCFLAFLYLRNLRGDRRQRGVRTLQSIRSVRGPRHHHSRSFAFQNTHGSLSAPASPTAGRQRHSDIFNNEDEISDNSINHEGPSRNENCPYIGQGGWRLSSSSVNFDRDNAIQMLTNELNRTNDDNEISSDPEIPQLNPVQSELSPFSSSSRKFRHSVSPSNIRSSSFTYQNGNDNSDSPPRCPISSFLTYRPPQYSNTHGILTVKPPYDNNPQRNDNHESNHYQECHSEQNTRYNSQCDLQPSFRTTLSLRSAFSSTASSPPQPSSPYNNRHHHDVSTSPSWIRILFLAEDKRFQSTDVQFYLLFLKTCQAITFSVSLVALFVVLPINVTCPSKSSAEGWLDRASAENVTADDARIWVLLTCTWIYSLTIYFYIYRFWMSVFNPLLLWNIDSFNPEIYTIMVEGLSRSETTPSILFDHFGRLFPGKVICANLVLDFSEFLVAKQDLKETTQHSSHVEIHQAENPVESQRPPNSPLLPIERPPENDETDSVFRDPTIRSPATGYFQPSSEINGHYLLHPVPRRTNVPSADPTSSYCHSPPSSSHDDVAYWRSLVEMRPMVMENVLAKLPSKNAGVGFVSFSDPHCVIQCLEDPRAVGSHYNWQLSPAPPPQDVVWFNIHVSKSRRRIRGTLLNILLIIASIFLTSSAILTNALLPLAENVEKAFNEADFFKLSVTGWGAPLILFIINSLCLPIMVYWVANSIGYWRLSDIESSVLHGNVIFLVLNTVIFPTLGNGSIGALIAQIYDTQIQKWNISLGRLIVGQSGSFALRYLLNSCFLHSASQLLQLGQLSWFGVLATFGKDLEQWDFDFGYNYAFCLSIFFMVISFGVVIPLVLPLGCLFFTFKYLVDKYNFLFGIWKVEHESAGAVASIASRYLLAAVSFFQFVMSGYFVAYGLHLASRDGPLPPDDAVTILTSGVSRGRGLVLSGTLLFVVSLVTAVLLIGHSADLFSTTKPRHHIVSDHINPTLTQAQECQLCHSYIHPLEHEIQERLNLHHIS